MNKFKMGTGENDQKKRKTSVSGKENKKPKLEKNLVKTKSDGLQTPPSSPILRQDEFPISLKSPTHENLDEIKSCLGKFLSTTYLNIVIMISKICVNFLFVS
jgi:hypothetical protein